MKINKRRKKKKLEQRFSTFFFGSRQPNLEAPLNGLISPTQGSQTQIYQRVTSQKSSPVVY